MAKILSAKPLVSALTDATTAQIAQLTAKACRPTLAFVRVGQRPDDLSYERGATTYCDALGVGTRHIALPNSVSQAKLIETIECINNDPTIHGCLLLRPLPADIDDAAVCRALDPRKDVDGITPASLYSVFANTQTGFPPCTAEACLRMLDFYHIDIEGRHIVVIGRSMVVGKPVSAMLQARNATVTMCHSYTRDLPGICRSADILIVAIGKIGAIGADCVHGRQTVVDVGINWDKEAGKLAGDVDFKAVAPKVSAITPVPGGIGSVTSAILVAHVVQASQRQNNQLRDVAR